MAEAGYGSGGSWLQMSGSLQYFLGDVLTGAVHWEGRTHVTHARSDPGFPHCECVHGSRVRNTILALPLKQRQSEYWSLWLPVPRMPKSRAYWSEGTRWWWGTVWFCFLKSCEVGDTEKWGTS